MSQRIAAAAAVLVALAVAGTASAGANKSTSSISLPIVVSAGTAPAEASTAPHYGDRITFNVSTTATSSAYVNVKCSQNGTMVGEGFAAFFAGGTPGSFVLSSLQWSGGAADCTADLGMFTNNTKWKVLASTSFHVNE
jgi:hypothetical protein